MEEPSALQQLWVPVLVACFGAGGFATVALKSFLAHKASKRRAQGALSFTLLSRAHSDLHQLMEAVGAHRALVLRAHNGGGPLSPAAHNYSSVMLEARDSELPRLLTTWVKQPVDEQYTHLLRKVVEQKLVVMEAAKMRTDSMLRALYLKHGVTHSAVMYLWNTETEMFYVSLAFKDLPEGWEMPEMYRESFRVAKTALVTRLHDKKLQ